MAGVCLNQTSGFPKLLILTGRATCQTQKKGNEMQLLRPFGHLICTERIAALGVDSGKAVSFPESGEIFAVKLDGYKVHPSDHECFELLVGTGFVFGE